MAVNITYHSDAVDAADATTYNGAAFQGMACGAESSDRVLIAAIGSRANAARTLDSVSIGGVAAVRLTDGTYTNSSTFTEIAELWAVAVPTGTTVDVFPTFSGVMLRCSIGVFSLTGTGGDASISDFVKDTANSGESPLTGDLDVPANGGCIATGWFTSASGAGSMTGVTESFENNPETASNSHLAGLLNSVSAQTPLTVTVASSTDFNGTSVMSAVSFAPLVTGTGLLQAQAAVVSGLGRFSNMTGVLSGGVATLFGLGELISIGSGLLQTGAATISALGEVVDIYGTGLLAAGLAELESQQAFYDRSPAVLSTYTDIAPEVEEGYVG